MSVGTFYHPLAILPPLVVTMSSPSWAVTKLFSVSVDLLIPFEKDDGFKAQPYPSTRLHFFFFFFFPVGLFQCS